MTLPFSWVFLRNITTWSISLSLLWTYKWKYDNMSLFSLQIKHDYMSCHWIYSLNMTTYIFSGLTGETYDMLCLWRQSKTWWHEVSLFFKQIKHFWTKRSVEILGASYGFKLFEARMYIWVSKHFRDRSSYLVKVWKHKCLLKPAENQ